MGKLTSNKIVKLVLILLGILLTATQTENVVWAATWITMACTAVTYVVKNWLMPSESPEGVFNIRDILSALILAVVAGVSSAIPDLVKDNAVDWALLWKTVGSVVLTYFTGTFFSGKQK